MLNRHRNEKKMARGAQILARTLVRRAQQDTNTGKQILGYISRGHLSNLAMQWSSTTFLSKWPPRKALQYEKSLENLSHHLSKQQFGMNVIDLEGP